MVVFRVDYANKLNRENMATAFIEVYRSTREVSLGFQRRVKAMVWGSLSPSQLNDKNWVYADSQHAGRWLKYVHLEVSTSFFRLAGKVGCESPNLL